LIRRETRFYSHSGVLRALRGSCSHFDTRDAPDQPHDPADKLCPIPNSTQFIVARILDVMGKVICSIGCISSSISLAVARRIVFGSCHANLHLPRWLHSWQWNRFSPSPISGGVSVLVRQCTGACEFLKPPARFQQLKTKSRGLHSASASFAIGEAPR
jgi:hypothetical protein